MNIVHIAVRNWIGVMKMIDEKRLIEEMNKTFPNKFLNEKNWFMGKCSFMDLFQNIIEEQPKVGEWIPFEQREADEEEKEYCLEQTGYEIEFMLCGKLPEEDEEILVSYKNGYVNTDVFLKDGNACYLDSGNEFVTEAIAWMPLPPAYKGE